MLTYDSKIIYEFAERLYKQATGIIVSYSVLGMVVGGIGGGAIGMAMDIPGLAAIVGAAVFGFVGYSLGVQKAFSLKLQAQLALCQVKVEENTRALSK